MEDETRHVSHLKMLVTDLTMGSVFLVLFGFSLWLIWITYFREHFDTGIIENTKISAIEQLDVSGMDKRDHFHNLDESLFKQARSPSACYKCHDGYAHFKTKVVRAFLNAHAYFMACEVCHIKDKSRANMTFRWFDDKSGNIKENTPTKVDAKIVPIEIVGRTFTRLDSSDDSQYVEKYISIKDSLNKSQREEANIRIHKNVADEAVVCDECHAAEEKSYLPYNELSYTQQRISELAGIEVIGMVKKYKNFYLPNLIHEKPF